MNRLKAVLANLDNDTGKLVIDLSCRRRGSTWHVAMDKWQTITDFEVNEGISWCLSLKLLIISHMS